VRLLQVSGFNITRSALADSCIALLSRIMFLREFPPAASVVQAGQAAQYPSLNGSHGAATNGTTTPSTSSVAGAESAGGDAFVPEQVYTAMASIARFDFMRQGHQEDAEEFLGFFLNTLHEEALVLLGRQPKDVRDAVLGKVDDLTRPEAAVESAASEQQSGDGWVEVGKKGKGSLLRQTGEQAPTALTRLFTGSNRSTVTIPSHPAVKPSISIEPFSPLQLDIQPAHVDSVESALAHMADPELIPGYALSSLRGGIADAVRRTELEVLPKVLVCHLKRFNWAEGARKMAKVIAFGETLEIPREAIAASRRTAISPKYKLFGGASCLLPAAPPPLDPDPFSSPQSSTTTGRPSLPATTHPPSCRARRRQAPAAPTPTNGCTSTTRRSRPSTSARSASRPSKPGPASAATLAAASAAPTSSSTSASSRAASLLLRAAGSRAGGSSCWTTPRR